MLAKLCKYEFKSIGRTLLPLYIAVLAASLISGVMGMRSVQNLMQFNSLLGGLPYVLINLVYFGLNVALAVVTLFIILQRFYKGLLCDEGYLMFTLPVKPWQLITSKGLVATVMAILSGVVSFVSMMILVAFYGNVTLPAFSNIASFFGELTRTVPSWPLFVVECIVLMLVYALGALFMLYASMALGHLAKRRRVALSFAAWLGLCVLFNLINGAIIDLFDRTGLDHMVTQFMYDGKISGVLATHLGMLVVILWGAVSLVIWFVITNTVLSRRLNLE